MLGVAPAMAHAAPVAVTSERIETFHPGSSETVFGRLEFLVGLVMKSPDPNFGGWSSIRLRPDQTHFVGVIDNGDWITGALVRDAAGRLAGIADVDVTPMLAKSGRPDARKEKMDAESLAFRTGEVLVSFERVHRVDVYPDPGFQTSPPKRTLSKLIPDARLKANKGLETVVVAPANGPLAGSPVIVAEESLNAAGDNYAAVLEGPRKGIFYVRRHGAFDISDGTFLPSGDLVLLERSFSLLQGVAIRLRLIRADDIRPDATVDGEELMVADLSYKIDNMEGVDAFHAADGSTHLVLVSDNNNSFLQSNLMLEFRLKD
ncbi:esterase-like activity of phytase family protein [Rhizobium sp. C4]|uniref:esterase-like activity of phytase family protein n=1 Tax=Rhizobium sp. C4 TaxID=1349800 RepID=UPI0022A95BE4